MTGPQEPRSTAAGHPAPEELSELAFSPEAAPAALRGHVQGCASCSAETAELRAVLASLAALPEPELPESVGIRLDAAIARAWQQQADAEQQAAADAATAPSTGRSRRLWRRLALPLGALCLIALAAVGVRGLLGGGTNPGGSAAGSGPAAGIGDAALAQWVHGVLPGATNEVQSRPAIIPQIGRGTANHSLTGAACQNAPARAGYTQLATSQRAFEGRPATLVVYQNAQEPASQPLFAVVYAGSCPTVSSVVLDQGLVSR